MPSAPPPRKAKIPKRRNRCDVFARAYLTLSMHASKANHIWPGITFVQHPPVLESESTWHVKHIVSSSTAPLSTLCYLFIEIKNLRILDVFPKHRV